MTLQARLTGQLILAWLQLSLATVATATLLQQIHINFTVLSVIRVVYSSHLLAHYFVTYPYSPAKVQ